MNESTQAIATGVIGGSPFLQKYGLAIIAVIVLASLGLTSLYKFWKRSKKLSFELKAVLADTKEFLTGKKRIDLDALNQISERMEKSSVLALAWNEFEETIIKDDRHENIQIYNTRSFSEFITLRDILDKELDAGSFAKMPGQITSLGLAFTFTFIVIGLSELEPKENGQILGVKKLIEGLAAKFISSVTALFLSIAITHFENDLIRDLEGTYRGLIDLLDQKFQKQTAEDYLRSVEKNMGELNKSMKMFGTDLAGVIKEGLHEGMRPSTDRLLQAIENLERQKSENVADTLEKMLSEFSAGLNRGTQNEFQEMGTAIQKMATVMNDSADRSGRTALELEKLVVSLGTQAKVQEQSSGEVTAKMQEGFVRMLESVERNTRLQSESLDKLLSDTVSKTTGATTSLINQVESLSDKNTNIMGGFETLNEKIGESVERYKSAVQSAGALLENTSQLARRLEETVDKLSKTQLKIGETAEHSVTESRVIQEIQKRNAELVTEFSKVFSVVEGGLKGVLEQLGSNMERYKGQTKEGLENYLKQYDDSMSKATVKLSASVGDLQDVLEGLTENLDTIRIAAENSKGK